MPGEKPSTGSYDTFDSGGGPLVPDGFSGDFAHQDADPSDHGVVQGAVPELPQKKGE